MVSIGQWRRQAIEPLRQTSESASLDVDCLLMSVLECDRAYLFRWDDRALNNQQLGTLNMLLSRRIDGEPVAYITGEREFWSLTLATNSSTLIPRADTETLVQLALDLTPDNQTSDERLRVLDLGTGTGAIALALQSERPNWKITAVDQSHNAIELAQLNAEKLALNVTFLVSNWFENVRPGFDLIVSNPPYIDPADPHLERGDVRFEPHTALVADEKGLADLRHIVSQSLEFLLPEGWLMLEHGYQQAEQVQQLMQQQGLTDVHTCCDLAGMPRVTAGKRSTT